MIRHPGETHATAISYGAIILSLLLGCLHGETAPAQELADGAKPAITLIIDDLGHAKRAGVRAVTLKGPVAVAILPHTRHSMLLAELAHLRAKEVLLHLPLQPEDSDWRPDPGGIHMSVGEAELLRILRKNLQVMPHVSGVSNHMGSLFTRQPGNMAWIMRELRRRDDLFFVDSYTHPDSVGLEVASAFQVPAVKRDVFLDDDPSPEAVAFQFDRLKRLARERGHAVGIGHPHSATLRVLETEIPRLADEGYELISVREMIRRRGEATTRQAGLPSAGSGSSEGTLR